MWPMISVLYSAPPIPAGILRNGTGILRNGTRICRNPQESSGILRNGTGIELKTSGMRREHYVYMQIYVYKHLYVNKYNIYNISSFCYIHLH